MDEMKKLAGELDACPDIMHARIVPIARETEYILPASLKFRILTALAQTAGEDLRTGGEALARKFHETYERLAPQFGYETREETRDFDPATPNGKLMVAVCTELLPTLPEAPASKEGGE